MRGHLCVKTGLLRIAACAQNPDLSEFWKVPLKCLLLMEPLTESLC